MLITILTVAAVSGTVGTILGRSSLRNYHRIELLEEQQKIHNMYQPVLAQMQIAVDRSNQTLITMGTSMQTAALASKDAQIALLEEKNATLAADNEEMDSILCESSDEDGEDEEEDHVYNNNSSTTSIKNIRRRHNSKPSPVDGIVPGSPVANKALELYSKIKTAQEFLEFNSLATPAAHKQMQSILSLEE